MDHYLKDPSGDTSKVVVGAFSIIYEQLSTIALRLVTSCKQPSEQTPRKRMTSYLKLFNNIERHCVSSLFLWYSLPDAEPMRLA